MGTHITEGNGNGAVSTVMTSASPEYNTTMVNSTSPTLESLSSAITYNWSNVSETSTEGATILATTPEPRGSVTPATPAVIVFSVIILILAIVIFGVRSKRRRKPALRDRKRGDNETLVTDGACKESIYLDVMPSNISETEADELQVDRETPYVTLEFDTDQKKEEISLENERLANSAPRDAFLPELQETKF